MAGRAGAILPIALGVVLARWGGAVGAPRSSQRLRAARRRAAMSKGIRPRASGLRRTAGRLFRWAPGTRSALTVQGLTRPVRERRSQGEGRTPRTVSTRSTPRSAAPGLLTQTPPTRCAFR